MPILGDGQVFERYRIVRWLGSGYSGESYEAEDRMLLRKVTLKLIHPWTTLPDSARRQFFREMQGLSTLNHPYLAAVLDYGESDGRLYVARRYVSSGSLLGTNGRLWYHPPLAAAHTFTYANQLAQVLHYIHQHGYLHGSLTFTNVLVLRGPNVEGETDHAPFLVADIGLANFVRRFGRPQVETFPVSAAPEQLGQRATPASDQFALAVLLYFWLAGCPPYLGTPEEVERLKLSGQITPVSTLHQELTTEQDQIIQRALAVYPEERYDSVLDFTQALQETRPPVTALSATSFTSFLTQETPRAPLRLPLHEALMAQTSEAVARTPEFTPRSLTEPPGMQPAPGVPPAAHQTTSTSLPPDELHTASPLPTERAETDQSPQSQQIGEASSPCAMPPQTPRSPQSEPDAQVGTETNDSTSALPCLIVCSPYTSSSYEFVLLNQEVNIGRAGSSDLHLEKDDLTSRHHALLKREGDRALLFDKRSYNGVFVNGQQIEVGQGYELTDGDHISIGNYELIYRYGPGHNGL
jgi:serine/threonine protein kinase